MTGLVVSACGEAEKRYRPKLCMSGVLGEAFGLGLSWGWVGIGIGRTGLSLAWRDGSKRVNGDVDAAAAAAVLNGSIGRPIASAAFAGM